MGHVPQSEGRFGDMPEPVDPDPPADQEVIETGSMANCATLALHGSAIEKTDTSGSPESVS